MRRLLLSVFVVLFGFAPFSTLNAQVYPNRVIKLVVPFPPGGLIDNAARLIGPELSKEMGQPVIIENKPGAGGNLAAAEVAKASPDGYTLLMASAPLSISPALYKTLPYNPANIEPIAILGQLPNVLLVNPESGINTVADLVKRAKANPGKLNYASNGNGTSLHLSAEMLKNQAGIFVVHIPYRGSTFANVGLVSKEVDFMFDNLPPALGLINGNKLKPLAVTTATRNPALPNVPTMIESGYPNFEVSAWFGIAAPKGIPDGASQSLQAALEKIVGRKEMVEAISRLGATVTFMNAQRAAQFMKTDTERWRKVIDYAKIQMD
ncbi:MAG: tripartite tricarboxylate transporter substrate binding protein [Betaproteobacteria bacterium]|nr:tripartite tricarboxylate transporter substrate binding protein [Betaproteobacteria bacterium]